MSIHRHVNIISVPSRLFPSFFCRSFSTKETMLQSNVVYYRLFNAYTRSMIRQHSVRYYIISTCYQMFSPIDYHKLFQNLKLELTMPNKKISLPRLKQLAANLPVFVFAILGMYYRDRIMYHQQ